jgi:hypothetical protein
MGLFGSIFEYPSESADEGLCVVCVVRDYDTIQFPIDGLELVRPATYLC